MDNYLKHIYDKILVEKSFTKNEVGCQFIFKIDPIENSTKKFYSYGELFKHCGEIIEYLNKYMTVESQFSNNIIIIKYW